MDERPEEGSAKMPSPFRQGRMPWRKARPSLTDPAGRSPMSAKWGVPLLLQASCPPPFGPASLFAPLLRRSGYFFSDKREKVTRPLAGGRNPAHRADQLVPPKTQIRTQESAPTPDNRIRQQLQAPKPGRGQKKKARGKPPETASPDSPGPRQHQSPAASARCTATACAA